MLLQGIRERALNLACASPLAATCMVATVTRSCTTGV